MKHAWLKMKIVIALFSVCTLALAQASCSKSDPASPANDVSEKQGQAPEPPSPEPAEPAPQSCDQALNWRHIKGAICNIQSSSVFLKFDKTDFENRNFGSVTASSRSGDRTFSSGTWQKPTGVHEFVLEMTSSSPSSSRLRLSGWHESRTPKFSALYNGNSGFCYPVFSGSLASCTPMDEKLRVKYFDSAVLGSCLLTLIAGSENSGLEEMESSTSCELLPGIHLRDSALFDLHNPNNRLHPTVPVSAHVHDFTDFRGVKAEGSTVYFFEDGVVSEYQFSEDTDLVCGITGRRLGTVKWMNEHRRHPEYLTLRKDLFRNGQLVAKSGEFIYFKEKVPGDGKYFIARTDQRGNVVFGAEWSCPELKVP